MTLYARDMDSSQLESYFPLRMGMESVLFGEPVAFSHIVLPASREFPLEVLNIVYI